MGTMRERRNDLEIMNWIPQITLQIQNSDQSPLYDVRNHASKVCEDFDLRSDVSRTIIRGALQQALHRSSNSIWWSQTGSNRRPHACKARALPAELWPRTRRRMPFAGQDAYARSRWWAWEDLNFRPHAYQARALTN